MFSADDLNQIPTKATSLENLIPTTANKAGLDSWDQPIVPLQQGDRIPGSPRRPTPQETLETQKLLKPSFFSRFFGGK